MTGDKQGYLRPTNLRTVSGREFWRGLAAGRLQGRRCLDCGSSYFPPRDRCPECLGDRLEWVEVSGRGTLHSWTEIHMSSSEFHTPFLLGLLDLAGGLGRLTAPIIDADADDLVIGMPAHLRYETRGEDLGLCRIALGPPAPEATGGT